MLDSNCFLSASQEVSSWPLLIVTFSSVGVIQRWDVTNYKPLRCRFFRHQCDLFNFAPCICKQMSSLSANDISKRRLLLLCLKKNKHKYCSKEWTFDLLQLLLLNANIFFTQVFVLLHNYRMWILLPPLVSFHGHTVHQAGLLSGMTTSHHSFPESSRHLMRVNGDVIPAQECVGGAVCLHLQVSVCYL